MDINDDNGKVVLWNYPQYCPSDISFWCQNSEGSFFFLEKDFVIEKKIVLAGKIECTFFSPVAHLWQQTVLLFVPVQYLYALGIQIGLDNPHKI